MDSSRSNDPFAPEGTTDVRNSTEISFNADRWERVGATSEEIDTLRESFESQTEQERAGLNGWMNSVSDADLLAWLNGEERTVDSLSIEDHEVRVAMLSQALDDAPKGQKTAAKRELAAAEKARDAAVAAADAEEAGDTQEGASEGTDEEIDPNGGQEPDQSEE